MKITFNANYIESIEVLGTIVTISFTSGRRLIKTFKTNEEAVDYHDKIVRNYINNPIN